MRMKAPDLKIARKVATNLSVRADLVREAKALGLNLSEVFETAIREAIRQRKQDAWREENREAIERYNAMVARDGLFSDGWRKF
jgi:antitoxin CcdA